MKSQERKNIVFGYFIWKRSTNFMKKEMTGRVDLYSHIFEEIAKKSK